MTPRTRRSRDHGGSRCGNHGFTIIEVCFVMVLAVFLLYSLHSTLQSSTRGRVSVERASSEMALAKEFLERLRSLSFGRATDPAATAAQLDELFDGDVDVGTATLSSLVVPADQPGHTFYMNADGLIGTWRIKVSRDLNRDGDTLDAREGRPDLIKIDVYFEDRLLLETMRAAEPAFTRSD